MKRSEWEGLSGHPFPELEAARAKARQRHGLTRLIFIGLSFAGGLAVAGLAYFAFWLASFGAQLAIGEAQAYAENRSMTPR